MRQTPDGGREPRVDPTWVEDMIHGPVPGDVRELEEVVQFELARAADGEVVGAA
jgi:hypothetical protein